MFSSTVESLFPPSTDHAQVWYTSVPRKGRLKLWKEQYNWMNCNIIGRLSKAFVCTNLGTLRLTVDNYVSFVSFKELALQEVHTLANPRQGAVPQNKCIGTVFPEILSSRYWSQNILWQIYSFPGEGDVWFSLRNATYQNNSIVSLKHIDEGDDALICITNLAACCRSRPAIGNWFFPNGTRVPGSGSQWDFHRTRGQMVVRMHRRRGGVDGIFHCEIPDAENVNQTIYIGVYSMSTGEWYIPVLLKYNLRTWRDLLTLQFQWLPCWNKYIALLLGDRCS